MDSIKRWLVTSPPVEWSINHTRELLVGALRQGPIPQHVAFVMDGNRRYARNHKIETVEGHNLGFEALARILEVCYKSGVKVVTIYAFSIENFKRSKYEVDALMEMAKVKLSQLAQHGDLMDRYGASIRILGQRDLIKPDVLEAIDKAVKLTSGNGNHILNVCFPYTSREEMTSAIRSTVDDYSKPLLSNARPFSQTRISQKIRFRSLNASDLPPVLEASPEPSSSDAEDSICSSTTLHPESTQSDNSEAPDKSVFPDPETINSSTITKKLYTHDNPPLDLLLRTSGVQRLSDFMLWQCHKDTDLVFLDVLWPEFDLWHFLPVLVEWQWKQKHVEERSRRVHRKSLKMVKAQ